MRSINSRFPYRLDPFLQDVSKVVLLLTPKFFSIKCVTLTSLLLTAIMNNRRNFCLIKVKKGIKMRQLAHGYLMSVVKLGVCVLTLVQRCSVR